MSWDMYDMTQKVQVVVVAIVLPLVILAASLWHDWVEEGQSPRARKIMKDWEWNIDEMAHAVNVKGRLIGYRVLQAGVIIYLGYSRLFRDYRSIELSVLAIVSIVAEVLFIIARLNSVSWQSCPLLLRGCLLSSKPFAIWRAMRIKRKCGNRWDTVCSII